MHECVSDFGLIILRLYILLLLHPSLTWHVGNLCPVHLLLKIKKHIWLR